MIRHKLYSKGEYIHALISNSRYTNIVFPVRAIIHDIEFDDKMPRYQIRIIKFYDDLDFLKRYMFDMKFDKGFDVGYTKFNFSREKYKTRKELQDHIDSKWESYLIVVDSVMCVRTHDEVFKLYNNIQDFIVEKSIRELFEVTNRSTYSTGKYFYKSRGVFEAFLKKFLGDRATNDQKYFDKLLFKPKSVDYDRLD